MYECILCAIIKNRQVVRRLVATHNKCKYRPSQNTKQTKL